MVVDDRVGAKAAVAGSRAKGGLLFLSPPAVGVDVGVNVGGAHCVLCKRIRAQRARGWW